MDFLMSMIKVSWLKPDHVSYICELNVPTKSRALYASHHL
jgi:hypothetical protein